MSVCRIDLIPVTRDLCDLGTDRTDVGDVDFSIKPLSLGAEYELMIFGKRKKEQHHALLADIVAREATAYELRSVGKYSEAVELFEVCLEGRTTIQGIDHEDTFIAQTILGLAYREDGRINDAIALQERTVEQRATLPPHHPELLISLSNLAVSYIDVGRTEEAIRMLTTCLQPMRELFGLEDPQVLAAQSSLGTAYQDLGQHGQALTLYKETLSQRLVTLGPSHPATLRSQDDVTGAYAALGRFDEAATLCREAMNRRFRVLGAEHPEALISQSNLALISMKIGQVDEGISLLKQTLAQRIKILGAEHPHTVDSQTLLAEAYYKTNRPDEAIDVLMQSIKQRSHSFGEEHPLTKEAQDQLARIASRRRVMEALKGTDAVVLHERQPFR